MYNISFIRFFSCALKKKIIILCFLLFYRSKKYTGLSIAFQEIDNISRIFNNKNHQTFDATVNPPSHNYKVTIFCLHYIVRIYNIFTYTYLKVLIYASNVRKHTIS